MEIRVRRRVAHRAEARPSVFSGSPVGHLPKRQVRGSGRFRSGTASPNAVQARAAKRRRVPAAEIRSSRILALRPPSHP